MAKVTVYDMTGAAKGEFELNDAVFGVEMNAGLVHQAVVRQLASQRLGTHKVKNRAEVRGGGRKPWRQKGTGRARAGSRRSPLWRSGGVIFGPTPRSYSFTMPRKQRRLALKCVLSDKVRSGDLIVLEELDFEAPKTKQMVKLLSDFKIESKALFITEEPKENVQRSSNNLQGVKALGALGLNVYDMLNHEKLFLTKNAVTKIEEVFA
ncbi:MAG: 50S ribosomal protein L4 [Selenomonadaceae bacterium]|nr:50S ribosomal protein L4 [Selenomonadaceae bacterium]